jgi:hypothetical protein
MEYILSLKIFCSPHQHAPYLGYNLLALIDLYLSRVFPSSALLSGKIYRALPQSQRGQPGIGSHLPLARVMDSRVWCDILRVIVKNRRFWLSALIVLIHLPSETGQVGLLCFVCYALGYRLIGSCRGGPPGLRRRRENSRDLKGRHN